MESRAFDKLSKRRKSKLPNKNYHGPQQRATQLVRLNCRHGSTFLRSGRAAAFHDRSEHRGLKISKRFDFSNRKTQWNQGSLINYQCAGRPAGSRWCKSTAMKE